MARNAAAVRQNLFTYSNSFENAAWPTTGFAVTPNDAANPVDGTVNAAKIVSVSGANVLYRGLTSSRGAPFTYRIWTLAGTHASDFIVRNNTAGVNLIQRTSSSGPGTTTSAYGTATATAVGGAGWLRMDMVITSGFIPGDTLACYFGATGGVPAGRYFWVYEGSATFANHAGPLCHTDAATVNTGPLRNLAILSGAGSRQKPPLSGVGSRAAVPWSQNLLTYSEQINNAKWSKAAAGTGIAPVVTPDYGTAPDGTLTADRVQFDRGASNTSGDYSRIFNQILSLPAGTYTESFWLKTADGSTVSVLFRDDAAGGINGLISVTPTWQRFSGVAAVSTMGNTCGIWVRGGGVTPTQTADLLMWGGQVVQANWAGPYQPTTTPAYNVGSIRNQP